MSCSQALGSANVRRNQSVDCREGDVVLGFRDLRWHTVTEASPVNVLEDYAWLDEDERRLTSDRE